MTVNKKEKAEARRMAKEHDISYTSALRQLRLMREQERVREHNTEVLQRAIERDKNE